jgi:hypothetical protein
MSWRRTLGEVAISRLPAAEPPMIRNSAGWSRTSIGPPAMA